MGRMALGPGILHLPRMPVITISRQFGSGGSIIAARVAHELEWPLLDNELVEAVAVELRVSVSEVEAREERVSSLVERLANALAMGSPETLPTMLEAPPRLSDQQLLDVTRRVVEEQVAKGSAVLVGRGAQLMLAARTDGLHVLCYGPRAALIARVVERTARTPDEAARVVDDTNRQRTEYVRKHWSRAWLAHENYHLCVNTAAFGIDGSVGLVLDAARRKLGAHAVPLAMSSGSAHQP